MSRFLIVAGFCFILSGTSSARVVAKHIFYNNSTFDNYNPGVNSQDDAAIATDKEALSPGQTATFANYTSYNRGINGIIIDVDRLIATPTAYDFEFRISKKTNPMNMPASGAIDMSNNYDSVNWITVTDPTIHLRTNAGIGGSDRIVLIWPDNVIENQWLQVCVRATLTTGLDCPDIFYFGNSIGDSGNSLINAWVTPIDELLILNYLTDHTPHAVDIEFDYDHNRDGMISPADAMIVINQINNGPASTLELITTPPILPDTIPSDNDEWTEFDNAILAKESGWLNSCGLSQKIVVSNDHIAGLSSVGCQAIQNRWDKPFEFATLANISQAEELKFFHKDSWEGRNVQLRIYMSPTQVEQNLGIVEKKVVFDYQTADSWTEFSGSLSNGIWSWKDEYNNWENLSGNKVPTTLIRVEWFHIAFAWITPVAVGDKMLIDKMHFTTSSSEGVFSMIDLIVLANNWLRSDCDQDNDNCCGADIDLDGFVDFMDISEMSDNWN